MGHHCDGSQHCDACDGELKYTPKVGDRVRVTYEGTIDWVSRNGFDFSVGENDYVELTTREATIEKLQDPEPDWVNGDVVRRSDGASPIVCIAGAWFPVDRPTDARVSHGAVSQSWDAGHLEILYKHTA